MKEKILLILAERLKKSRENVMLFEPVDLYDTLSEFKRGEAHGQLMEVMEIMLEVMKVEE